jgi:hypothetical protein
LSASGNKSWPPIASRFEVVSPDRTWVLSSGDNLADAALWVEHLMDCLGASQQAQDDNPEENEEEDDDDEEYGARETVGGEGGRETVGGHDDGAFDFLEALEDQEKTEDNDDSDLQVQPRSAKVSQLSPFTPSQSSKFKRAKLLSFGRKRCKRKVGFHCAKGRSGPSCLHS